MFSVTIGTAQRQPVFSDVSLGLECVALLRQIAHRQGTIVVAYCLMPDHVHLLLDSGPETPLPATLQAWKSVCYRAWRRRGHAASFWQRSFYDHALRRDADLRQVTRYIINNPVRKGLVGTYREYPLCGSFVWDLEGIEE